MFYLFYFDIFLGVTMIYHLLSTAAETVENWSNGYFKDAEGVILYVGKANNLRKRTTSYLRGSISGDIKTRVFLAKATDIEYIVTSGEKEALPICSPSGMTATV